MNTKSDKTGKVESKQIYTVGNRNFKEKGTAEYYAELGECCERYLAADLSDYPVIEESTTPLMQEILTLSEKESYCVKLNK